MTGTPCWLLDHPRGHDIARYSRPAGPPTPLDKVHAGTLWMLALAVLFAAAAAGPWVRARRSLAFWTD